MYQRLKVVPLEITDAMRLNFVQTLTGCGTDEYNTFTSKGHSSCEMQRPTDLSKNFQLPNTI